MFLLRTKKSSMNFRVRHRAFSLVELMVSLSIFAIVMTVSVGAIFTMIDANAKAQSLYSVMTNLSFAIDSMTRNIRTSYDYNCISNDNSSVISSNGSIQSCTSGSGSRIDFTLTDSGVRGGYRYKNDSIYQYQGTDWLKITDDNVKITVFNIFSDGAEPYLKSNSDTKQARVMLYIEGYVVNGIDMDTDFRLQTDMGRRVLDL